MFPAVQMAEWNAYYRNEEEEEEQEEGEQSGGKMKASSSLYWTFSWCKIVGFCLSLWFGHYFTLDFSELLYSNPHFTKYKTLIMSHLHAEQFGAVNYS